MKKSISLRSIWLLMLCFMAAILISCGQEKTGQGTVQGEEKDPVSVLDDTHADTKTEEEEVLSEKKKKKSKKKKDAQQALSEQFEEQMYTTTEVNLRAEASQDAAVLRLLPAGSEVLRSTQQGEWSYVQDVEGLTGYVFTEYLTDEKQQ